MINSLDTLLVVVIIMSAIFIYIGFLQYRKVLREAKNFERGLKMSVFRIHLPPASDDMEASSRDERDVVDELISKTQMMYNILASTYTKSGFKGGIYGQRHFSFEMISTNGLVQYYAVVPSVLRDVMQQAVAASYPSARLEEVEEPNIFNANGKLSGVAGGEFSLKKDFVYPIATYKDLKSDSARALLNSLAAASKEDGIGLQIMLRPASEGWSHISSKKVKDIQKKSGDNLGIKNLIMAFWKAPDAESKKDSPQLSSIDQAAIDAIEEKTKHPGFEVLIRVVTSSTTTSASQALLKNVLSAFSLFDSQSFNGFKFNPAKDLDELVSAYIFRFFPQSTKSNILNSIELATIFHLPDERSIPTSQVKRQVAKQVDGPTEEVTDGLLLGVNEFRDHKKEIRLSVNDRRRHVYFIGQTGTGKSVFLRNLAYQDMLEGKGFAVIDPHGDLVDDILSLVPKDRVEDVVYFNPSDMENPIGLNMFDFKSQDQKDFIIQEMINILYSLYDPNRQGMMGARFEQIFRNVALLLMSDPNGGTLIDIPKVLVDADFRNSKLKYVTDRTLLDYWTKEWVNAQRSSDAGEVTSWFASKFGAFLSNTMMRNIIGQTKSTFDLRDIMDNKKILLVNLSKGLTGELNSRLLGMIFVMKFQVAAMSRADTPEANREDFCLYVDEFQNFATDSFESIMSEARKYRLNLVLAHQFMAQLTDKIRSAVLGNVGTIISGRIGIEDAELLQKKFSPVFDAEDLSKLPNYQTLATVMINDIPSAPFSMSLIPPVGSINKDLATALKKLSATKYGSPRREVEAAIDSRLTAIAALPNSDIDGEKRRQDDIVNRISNTTVKAKPDASFLDEWLAKRNTQSAKNSENSPMNENSKSVPRTYSTEPASEHLDVRNLDNGDSQEEFHFKVRR